eukprot:3108421-Prymnesium_polylepis.1
MTDPDAAAALVNATVSTILSDLGVERLDMLTIKDSASCPVMQAQWAAAEGLLVRGLTRALGLYNYCEFGVSCILATAKTRPAVNIVLRHVGMGADAAGLAAFNAKHGIRTAAYGSLGEPVALSELLSDPTLVSIAAAHHRSVEEVALKWNMQAGFAVTNRPTADYAPSNKPFGSACTAHCSAAIGAMAQAHDWELTSEEVSRLDALNFTSWSQSPTYYSSTGCANSFAAVDHPTASVCATRKDASGWC